MSNKRTIKRFMDIEKAVHDLQDEIQNLKGMITVLQLEVEATKQNKYFVPNYFHYPSDPWYIPKIWCGNSTGIRTILTGMETGS